MPKRHVSLGLLGHRGTLIQPIKPAPKHPNAIECVELAESILWETFMFPCVRKSECVEIRLTRDLQPQKRAS
jgi:hypothetical protein